MSYTRTMNTGILAVLLSVSMFAPSVLAEKPPHPCTITPGAEGCPDDSYSFPPDVVVPCNDPWEYEPWVPLCFPMPPFGPMYECNYGGSGWYGDGVYLNAISGRVAARVPIFESYSEGGVDLGLYLTYDSLRHDQISRVGYGWTHTMNQQVEIEFFPVPAMSWFWRVNPLQRVHYTDENGQTHTFAKNPNDFLGFPTTVADGSNYEITWERYGFYEEINEGQGEIPDYKLTIHRPDGIEVIFEKDQPTLVKDPQGLILTIGQIDGNNEQQIISPHGRVATLHYAYGKLSQVDAPDGTETTIGYDGYNLETITDDDSNVITYDYDANHRLTSETLQNGTSYTVQYGSTYRQIKDSQNNVIVRADNTQNYMDEYGTDQYTSSGIVTVTDAEAIQLPVGERSYTYYYYDTYGRTTKVIDPLGNESRTAYGTTGYGKNRVVSTTLVADSGLTEDNIVNSYSYNSKGRMSCHTGPEGNQVTYQYQTSFPYRMTQRTISDDSATTDDDRVWQYTYTSDGRVETVTDPIVETPTDKILEFAYEYYTDTENTTGFPTRTGNYPGRMKKMTMTDRNGNLSVTEYDGSGNTTKKQRGSMEDETFTYIEQTRFDHDSMGRTTKVLSDKSATETLITKIEYNDLGQLTKVIQDPTSEGGTLNITREFVYDGYGNLLQSINPRLVTTDYDYDHRNRPTEITIDSNGLGSSMSMDYDGNGNVTMIEDAEDHQTHFYYDAAGQLDYFDDAQGNRTELDYDEFGNIETLRRYVNGSSGDKQEIRLEYDKLFRTTKTIAENGATDLETIIEYTSTAGCSCAGSPGAALPTKIQDPSGRVVYMMYDKLNHLTDIIQKVGSTTSSDPDADDAHTEFEYDAMGNRTAIIGPDPDDDPSNGITSLRVEFEYNAANRLLKQIVDPSGEALTSSWAYDWSGTVAHYTPPNHNVVDYTYDAVNRLTQVEDEIGLLATYTYDANGNILTTSDANTNGWTFQYDNLDRLIHAWDPVIESGEDKYSTYTWDLNSNLTMLTNNKGVQTKYTYDSLSRLTEIIANYCESNCTNDSNVATRYAYDGLGRITEIQDVDSNGTLYDYDLVGRIESITYPDAVTGTVNTVTYSYDVPNKQVIRTDQNGVVQTSQFDDLGHLSSRTYVQNSQTLLTESYTRDKLGRIASATNGNTAMARLYDVMGRLTSESQTFGTGGSATTYTTGLAYNITTNGAASTRTLTYPTTRTVTESFDYRGRMVGVTGGTNIGAVRTYDAANRLIQQILGNGNASKWEYDNAGRITRIRHSMTLTSLLDEQIPALQEWNYGYDEVGNKKWMENVTDPYWSEYYTYDNLNRLRLFGRGTLNAAKTGVQSYQTDPDVMNLHYWPITSPYYGMDGRGNWDNHIRRFNTTSTMESRTDNQANECTSIDPDGPTGPELPQTLTYDDNGNLLTDPTAPNLGDTIDPGQKYEYDVRNRLTKVWRTNDVSDLNDDELLLEIEYDVLGRRVVSTEHVNSATGAALTTPNVTRHVYLGLKTVAEYDVAEVVGVGETVSLAREFIWGISHIDPIALIDHTDMGDSGSGTEEILHYLHDSLGSTIALANTSGVIVERYDYDPYGTTYIWNADRTFSRSRSMYGNPWMWTGQRFDSTTQLYHFPFRSYSPTLGRWLQRDPLGYVDGINLYEYVGSTPTGGIDTLGLQSKDPDPGSGLNPEAEAELKQILQDYVNLYDQIVQILKHEDEIRENIQNELRRIRVEYQKIQNKTYEDWKKANDAMSKLYAELAGLDYLKEKRDSMYQTALFYKYLLMYWNLPELLSVKRDLLSLLKHKKIIEEIFDDLRKLELSTDPAENIATIMSLVARFDQNDPLMEALVYIINNEIPEHFFRDVFPHSGGDKDMWPNSQRDKPFDWRKLYKPDSIGPNKPSEEWEPKICPESQQK